MRADFLMCGIGSDARGFLHNKRAVVSEALLNDVLSEREWMDTL